MSEWISVKDRPPPTLTRLLVVKYYLDHEWDMVNGGYTDKPITLGPEVQIDLCFSPGRNWNKGGFVTHWQLCPEPPKDKT